MSYTDEVIHSNCNEKQCDFKHYQLSPIEVLDETVNVLAGELPSEVLNETEGDGPKEVEEEFFALFGLGKNLVLPDEIEHGCEGPAMDPHTEHFYNERPFLAFENTFREKDP